MPAQDWWAANSPKKEGGDWWEQNAPSSGPGRGGRMFAGSPTAEAPDPKDSSLMARFAGGVDQLTNLGGNRPGQKLKGLHNAIVGGAQLASPFALAPVAAAGSIPAAAGVAAQELGAAAIGYGAGKGARGAASLAGVEDPDKLDLIEDAGGAAGGVAGAKYGPQLFKGSKGFVKELAPERLKKAGSAFGDAFRKARTQEPPTPEPPTRADVTGQTFEVRNKLRELGGTWDKERKVWTVPKEKLQRAQDIVAKVPEIKVEAPGYRARGERSPRDLGKLPGDTGPAREPLKAPGGVYPATNEADAAGMAKIMQTHGISGADAAKMTPTEWQLVASNAGLKSMPSPETIQAAVAKLEGGKPLRVRRTQAGR